MNRTSRILLVNHCAHLLLRLSPPGPVVSTLGAADPSPSRQPRSYASGGECTVFFFLSSPSSICHCCSTKALPRSACNTERRILATPCLEVTHIPEPCSTSEMTSDAKRKSYLTLTPVNVSLTAGTNIPAPPDTPPKSPALLARPPTAGGGPLSSHPTSEDNIPQALPPTPEPETEAPAKVSTSTSSDHNMDRTDSFNTPASPSSVHRNSPKPSEHKQTQSVRKLFSLNNLRQSFSSSRTSLHVARPSTETSPRQPQQESFVRPASQQPAAPQMRPRSKSGSWFKRKSSMFMFNGGADLDAVVEDRPATRDSAHKIKEESHTPAPLLPELNSLGAGTSNGGDLGWDDAMFKR